MFSSFPLGLNAIIFVISAGIIWFAGTYLEYFADSIAERTSMGQAFTGVLLLSAATSLPELATTVTAIVFLGSPTLAVYNMLGGVAFQTAILVAADMAKKPKGALTFFSPQFVLLIQGVGVIILLQLAIAGISVGGSPIVGTISIWSVLLFLFYLVMMFFTYRFRRHPRWKPVEEDKVPEHNKSSHKEFDFSMKKLWWAFFGTSIAVLVAGWGAAQAADVLAQQTGLGPAFLGATLLAAATSLPELSTTTTASKNGRYSMAISNIFGSNAFDISLLFIAELLYFKDTIIKKGHSSVVFLAGIGALMTGIYLWGLMEREDKTIAGIGWDSATCLLIYIGAMIVLYFTA